MKSHSQRTWALLLILLSWAGIAAADNAELVDVFTQDVTCFTQLLTNTIAEKRVEGAQGLSHLKHWQSEDALIRLLNDNSPLVRREVVFALTRLGTAKSVPHLIRLLDDESWEIRQHAHIGLCRMTAKNIPINQKKQWENWWKADYYEERRCSDFQRP